MYEADVATIRKLWRDAHVEETKIEEEGDGFPYIAKKSFEYAWVSPIIFLGAQLLNPYSVTVALNVISNYLTDVALKRLPRSEQNIQLCLVLESVREGDRDCAKAEYTGHPDRIPDEFKKLIERIFNSKL